MLYSSVMLTHNAPAVNCFKYFTAKSTLVSILLHYFLLCCSHDCNVDAHAKNIPTLVVVLCPILCRRKLLTQRLTAIARGHLGGICVYTCALTDCTDASWSAWSWTSVHRLYSIYLTQPIRDQLAATALTNQRPRKSDTATHILAHYI